MSKYDIKEFTNGIESTYFDRKSSRIAPKDIVKHIVAFANASGGKLVIGVEDNGDLTGFNDQKISRVDEYEKIIMSNVKPTPHYETSKIKFTNSSGIEDFILVINVYANHNSVVFTSGNDCFLRMGDSSIKLDHHQITKLEYDKGQRLFEDEIIEKSGITDIDEELVASYKSHRNCEEIGTEQLLRSRGFLIDGKLTNAGMLLFGKDIFKYLPNSRIRFLRYDGIKNKTGQRMNIIKEFDYEGAIPYLIERITDSVKSQLRDFQYLQEDGKFRVLSEYPEFAWFEGVVNALTHRDYSYKGDYVRIEMYDNRLEIFSPGKLPNIVTIENMRTTRYSRNPRIARTLTEFGWVRELNEGVNRIYDEMEMFYLKVPIYSEPNNNSVMLVLENNILSRHLRTADRVGVYLEKFGNNVTSENERTVLTYLYNYKIITVNETANILEKSLGYARGLLKGMKDRELIIWNGTSNTDPTQYYELNKSIFDGDIPEK